MQVTLPEDTQNQSLAAGFSSVEQYVYNLVQQDKERLAIEQGIESMKHGRLRPFDDFDLEFRHRHQIGE